MNANVSRPPRVPHFYFYGGKGGVGKTTCASAHAVAAAREGSRVLVVSTDPAHSLGDALRARLSFRVARIAVGAKRKTQAVRGPIVHAVELDAPRAFARWLQEHRQALGDILEHGTWLDREDVESLLGLSVPGIDELAGMLEVVRLASSNYDCIVVDTAPTGHALRLLAAPEMVGNVAAVLEALQYEHRLIREQLARVRRPEAADRLITLLAEQANDTRTLLRDPTRTTVRWVMLPEALSLAETEDALTALDTAGIPVPAIIVNRVTPDGPPCRICDGRRAEERRVITRLTRGTRAIGKRRSIRFVPAALREPRGTEALASLSPHVTSASAWRPGPLRLRNNFAGRVVRRKGRLAFPTDQFRQARLLFLGGKGGVGKTTTAAAVALQLARAQRGRNVLLLSTDPAHSLGDVFNLPVGDDEGLLPGAPPNLRVRELDAARAFAARRADLEAALDEISGVVGAVATGNGEVGLGGLIDLAPPGIDELFGLVSLLKDLALEPRASSSATAGAPQDLIIIDTAPTGHALRLLQMPETAREWVQALLRVLLKYRNLVRPGQLAADLVELSKSIRTLQQLMRDPRQAHFIVVTRAAALPRLETERLIGRLRRLRLNVPILVVNGLSLAPGRCPQCRATAAAEKREVSILRRACRQCFRDCAIIQTPLVVPPPRGVAALERWAQDWIATNER